MLRNLDALDRLTRIERPALRFDGLNVLCVFNNIERIWIVVPWLDVEQLSVRYVGYRLRFAHEGRSRSRLP